MIKFSTVLIFFLFSFSILNAQLLSASHTGLDLTIDIMVNVPANEVEITMTGTADSWFAYGFGNNFMTGTYAFLIESPNGGEVFEMKLGTRAIGDTLVKSITDPIFTDSGANSRTVTFKRPRIGENADYYTFPASEANISFIYSNANGPTMAYHGFGNKAVGTQNSMSGLQFSSVVPVIWSSFNLKEKNGKTLAIWETESEVNNSGFYVQRSLDAINWEDLEFVDAQNSEGSTYQYLDEKSLPGVSYYRLRQVDYDGVEQFSVVKSIEIRGNHPHGEIIVYPNPVQSEVNLRFEGGMESGLKRVQILDMNARILVDQVWGEENSHRINLREYPSGHYLITVKHKNWGYTGYFIKQ